MIFSFIALLLVFWGTFLVGRGEAVLPPEAAGLAKVTAQADQTIVAEKGAGEYRVGLFVDSSRVFSLREKKGLREVRPASQESFYLGVVLREQRTKRFLPAANVRVTLRSSVGTQEIALHELWGEFPHYGNNLSLPQEGEISLTVSIAPPAYSRHADMISHFMAPVESTFVGRLEQGALHLEPLLPLPIGTDYEIGQDIVRAFTEAREVQETEEYKIGFIAEGPEPIWLWKEGKLGLRPIARTDTHHLEIVLLDKASGQLVPNAPVTLVLREEKGDREISVPMHPLLSDFAHYGTTLEVPAAEYIVQVRVDPPGFGLFTPPRFAAAEAQFRLNATPGSVAAEEITAQVKGALEQYRRGERVQAATRLQEAFWGFESSEVDRLLKARDYELYRAMEGEWLKLAALMKREGAPTEVERRGQKVLQLISQGAERARARTTVGPLFINSLVIILREGVEAILILSALATYLRKTGHQSRIALLYGGAGVGVLASVLLAFTAQEVLVSFSGMQEALEGITMLVAVVVLFWVSYWLISKTEARRWQEFVQGKVEGALSTGRYIALGSLAFLVVFREGFETVLFYQALVMSAARETVGYMPVVTGFAVGCMLLAALFYALFTYGVKIPIRRFFAVTGALLYLLAFKFAGDGMRELQEAGLVSVTPLSLVPELPFLQGWFGVYPVWETLFLQSFLLLAAVGGLLYTFAASQMHPAVPARLHQEGR